MTLRTATDEVRFAQEAERAELPVPSYDGADLDYGEIPAWHCYGGDRRGIASFFGPEWIAASDAAYNERMTITPTPTETFTNTETNMESYVYASTDKPGTYNVTLKDLDSGEFVPSAFCGLTLEAAKTKAKKVVGLV